MARRIIGLEDFDRMEIDPETGQLFWDGAEVMTVIALPAIVNYAIVAGAIAGVLAFAWSVIRYFLERSERRHKAVRGANDGS